MADVLISAVSSLAFSLLKGLLDPQRIEGQRQNTKDVPSSRYGDPIAKYWAVGRGSGTLIWAVQKTESSTESGGKGQPVVTEYHYAGSFAYLLGEGELDLVSIYLNNKIWWSIAPDATPEQITLNGQRSQYFTFYRGTANQPPDPTIQSYEGINATSAHRHYSYIVFKGLPLDEFGGGFPLPQFEVIAVPNWTGGYASLPVATIVQEICKSVRIRPDQVDTSQIASLTSRGFARNQITSARSLLETLQQVYFFHILQLEGKIVCKPYGQTAAVALTTPEFLSRNNSSLYDCRVLDPNTLPLSFQLEFKSAIKHGQATAKFARRYPLSTTINGFLSNNSTEYLESNQKNLNVEVFLAEDEGQTKAFQMLSVALSRTREYDFQVPGHYLEYALGSVAAITLPNGYLENMLIDSVDLGIDYTLNWRTVSYDSAFADISLLAGIVSPVLPIGSGSGASTNLIILDMPIWNGSINESIVYAAMWGSQNSWPGASAMVSINGGSNYSNFAANITTSRPSIFGVRLTSSSAPPAASAATVGKVNVIAQNVSAGYIDEISKLTITLEPYANSDLLTITTDEFNKVNSNFIYIEREIIQFKTATLIGPRQYRLTSLRRGLLGTTAYIPNHQINAYAVRLNNKLIEGNVPTAQIGQSALIAAVTSGQTVAQSTVINYTPLGNSLKPLPPANLRGYIENDGDIKIEWNRLAKKHLVWVNAIDAPLQNDLNKYIIEIYTTSNQFIRSISITDQSFYLYPSALRIADIGVATSFIAKVAQLNATVGSGYQTTSTINI
jgi:hypothetical protein